MNISPEENKTNQLSSMVRGELLFNEPMSKHTSWRVGGPADCYFKPKDIDDLSVFLKSWKNEKPLYWIGLGSNLLVRDGGIRGTVIVTSGLLNGMSIVDENVVRAEAGVACPKVSRFSAKNDLIGAEFLSGIPGTIGGALKMNAGAFGGETWDKIQSVETIDRDGELHLRFPDEYNVSYRHVYGPKNEWFVAGRFSLAKGDGEKSLRSIKALLEKRNESQPTNQPSCGSVFRNPENDYAARLIETSGLKGASIGGACVSEKHANFIVNTGNATADDIEQLIEFVQTTVEKKHSIKLIREAHIVGESL
ncbi:MAG: UDP-N-acetylmuramate dehydrogenase [Gammaproteobacteria bacterium]|nr:UDP-N-acetylmuramate dehydrogenase [Gammaproteobacteria bacterium]